MTQRQAAHHRPPRRLRPARSQLANRTVRGATYVAAVNSTTLADGVVLDLGGGRLQLTSVAGRQAQRSSSWPLGAVRVTEQHLASSRAVSRKQLKAARAAVRGQLGDVNLILQSGLPGYGPREVARIAEVVRHHRKGSPDDGLVARCALLLRLAEQLDRGQDQAVIEARLVAERRALRLRLRGDDRLARWSLERRLSDGAFRRVFGRRLVVTR